MTDIEVQKDRLRLMVEKLTTDPKTLQKVIDSVSDQGRVYAELAAMTDGELEELVEFELKANKM